MQTKAVFQQRRADLADTQEARQIEKEMDADLAGRIQMRDQAAMAELYNRYRSLTFTLIFRMVADRAIAEDLTQETFMRVWVSISSFDLQRGTLRTWLVAIARNKAIDFLRSAEAQSDRTTCRLDGFWSSKMGRQENFEKKLAQKWVVELLNDRIKHLPDRQRESILLAFVEGKTHAEIAETLQTPLGSVKTWIRSGLQRLRGIDEARVGIGWLLN